MIAAAYACLAQNPKNMFFEKGNLIELAEKAEETLYEDRSW